MKLAVASAACLALLPVSSPAAADTLIENVQGIALDEQGQVQRFAALWIDDDGRVKQLLDRTDTRPQTDYLVDGKGAYLMPGLIDAHLHVMGIGFGALTLDLSATTTLEEAQRLIGEYAAANPGRRWIIGRGWNQEKWGLGRFPTAADLDSVVADRPVWLERVDGHAGWANSKAMELAGVTAVSKDPAGGRIERIGRTQAPAGVFVDAASALVQKVVPVPSPDDRDVALSLAQDALLGHGITAAADMGTTIEDWQSFRRAGDSGWLKLRIMAYAAGPDAMELIGGPGPSPWLYQDKLRLNGVKLYLDGALGSRGAWLKRPYADDPANRGLPLATPAQLRNTMSRAALDRFQIAVHAIGDAANAEILAAIDELAPTYPGDRRWRIEHAQVVDPADIAAFAKHGVIASMQPVHQTSDRTMAEARLDPPRLEGAYAWNSIAQTGAMLAFGSDAPVESPDPFAGLAAAFTRQDASGQPFAGWFPNQRITRESAIWGFTYGAAFAGFAESRFGRLAPGLWADFILVDRDPLLSSPSDLRATQVLETWVSGQRAFVRNAPAGR
jgi:predicted amidohydrolase YtcJ